MSLYNIWKSGFVNRWHTHPHPGLRNAQDTTGAHMWRVTVLVDIFVVETLGDTHADFGEGVLQLTCALRHDMPEVDSGDMGYPFKQENPEVKSLLKDFDDKWFEEHRLDSIPPSALVIMCDRLDAYLFMLTHARDLRFNAAWSGMKEDILDQATDLGLAHKVSEMMNDAELRGWF